MSKFDVKLEDALAPKYARTVVFIGVVVFHGIAFVTISNIRVPKSEEQEFVSTFLVIEPRKRKDQAAKHTSPHQTRAAKASEEVPVKLTAELNQGTAITPLVDWNVERERVTEQRTKEAAAQLTQRSLQSKPTVMKLPEGETKPEPSNSNHFDDGEIITWISGNCYVTNHDKVTPQLDPERARIECKRTVRTKIVDGFDQVKPRYLRKPDEAPAKPKSLFTGEPVKCSYSTVLCDDAAGASDSR